MLASASASTSPPQAPKPPLPPRDMRQELEQWRREKYEKLQLSQGSVQSPLRHSAKKVGKRCSHCRPGRHLCGQSNCPSSYSSAPLTPSKERRGHVSAVSPLSEIRRSDPNEEEVLRAANRCMQSMFLAQEDRHSLPSAPPTSPETDGKKTSGRDTGGVSTASANSDEATSASGSGPSSGSTTSFSSSAIATRSAAAFGLLAMIRPSPFEPTPYLARLLEASLAAVVAEGASGLIPKAVLNASTGVGPKGHMATMGTMAGSGSAAGQRARWGRAHDDLSRVQKDLFPHLGCPRSSPSSSPSPSPSLREEISGPSFANGRAGPESRRKLFGAQTSTSTSPSMPDFHGPEDLLDPAKQLMASAGTRPRSQTGGSSQTQRAPASVPTAHDPARKASSSNSSSTTTNTNLNNTIANTSTSSKTIANTPSSTAPALRGARRNLFDNLEESPEASPEGLRVRSPEASERRGPGQSSARFFDLSPASHPTPPSSQVSQGNQVSQVSRADHINRANQDNRVGPDDPIDDLAVAEGEHGNNKVDNGNSSNNENNDNKQDEQDKACKNERFPERAEDEEEDEEDIELLDLSDLVDNGGTRSVPHDADKRRDEDLACRSIGQVETEDRSSPDVEEDDMNATTLDRSPSSSPSSSCSSSCCSSPVSNAAAATAVATTARATATALQAATAADPHSRQSCRSGRGSRTLRRLRRQLVAHEVTWPQLTPLGTEDHLSRAYDLSMFWFFESRDRVACMLPEYADRPFLPLEEIAEYPSEWPAWKIRSFEMRTAVRAGRRKSKGSSTNLSTGTAGSDREDDAEEEVEGEAGEARTAAARNARAAGTETGTATAAATATATARPTASASTTIPPPRLKLPAGKVEEAATTRMVSPRPRSCFEGGQRPATPQRHRASGQSSNAANGTSAGTAATSSTTAFGRSSGPRFAAGGG